MTALSSLAKIAQRMESDSAERDRLIVQSRREGATWDQISAAARMSRAGAIKAANRVFPDSR